MAEQPTIQTDRLLLRPFALADGPAVQRLAGDRAVADTTLRIPHPYEDGAAERWIATHPEKFDRGEAVEFAITLRQTGELLGAIGLGINREHERAALGYWIGRACWNRGYCTEAARAVVRYGFTELRLNRIFAVHLTRNPASGRVLQKIGMTREGRLRQEIRKWGRFEDLEVWAILRAEFEGD